MRYHVEVHDNYYSVPHPLLHERLEARTTATTVEILVHSRRVASHPRQYGRGKYATLPEHMPASHRAYLEWSPSRLVHWAESTGPAAGSLVTRILEHRPHPEQGYRFCLGLLRLGKKYGAERLEAASRRALHLRSYSYQTVKNILAAETDRLPLEDEIPAVPVPVHENIRGADYYVERETPC